MNILTIVILVAFAGFCCAKSFDLCKVNEDTHGSWHVTSLVNLREASRHFVDGYYGEAVQFSKMWLPHNCSYHRFTNASLQAVASHLVTSGKYRSKNNKLHLMFMGDSITRGIVCGIVRILSGSEMFGPSSNVFCGHPGDPHPPSHDKENKQFIVDYGNIIISFVYIKVIEPGFEASMQALEMNVFQKPYSLVLNTGAWSFWLYPIKPTPVGTRLLPGDDCETPMYIGAKEKRTQVLTQEAFARAGKLGEELGVKMIYRTNHYNVRFGVNCADGELIPLLRERKWDIWDNTRISKDVWQEQTYDGFHFDRTLIHTEKEHKEIINHALQHHLELPGMLEIQFAQSLLHYLFRDTIQDLITKGITLPTV